MSVNPSIYIVEDDIITQSQIRGYLLSAGYEVAGKSKSAEEAWDDIQSREVDLIILDINLSGAQDGLWLAKKLREAAIPFIFLTAYNDKETIKEATDLEPNGYLIKPFQEMDLYSAIELGLKNFALKRKRVEDDNIVVKDSIFIKEEGLLVKMKLNQVHFIMSEGNYLELHLAGKKHLIRSKITDFMELLPANMFVRVHQRYIINLQLVEAIGASTVLLAGKDIPVSKVHKEALLQKIKTV